LLEDDLKKVKGLLNKCEALTEEGKIKEAQNVAGEALRLLESCKETYGDDRKIWTFMGDTYNYYYPLEDFAENKRKAVEAYIKALGDDVSLLQRLSEAYSGFAQELGPRKRNNHLMMAIGLSGIYLEVFRYDHEEFANLGSYYFIID